MKRKKNNKNKKLMLRKYESKQILQCLQWRLNEMCGRVYLLYFGLTWMFVLFVLNECYNITCLRGENVFVQCMLCLQRHHCPFTHTQTHTLTSKFTTFDWNEEFYMAKCFYVSRCHVCHRIIKIALAQNTPIHWE